MIETMEKNYRDLYERAWGALEKRLSNFRFLHSVSVADTASDMATHYGLNVNEARIAGLLHDWDKNCSDEELFERVEKFGLKIKGYEEDMVALMHAQTGAVAVKLEFPELSDAVIQAIARHTSAAPTMSDLDMIIYIADMIEPLRTRGNLAPIRWAVGKISLEELFVKAYEMTMLHLVRRHRFVHPDSLEVWNAYIQRERTHFERPKKNSRD